jgi:agmatine/peptidylarginine deiminase
MSIVYRLPAEWEPQAGVLLAWPHALTDWADRLAETEASYAALIGAIVRYELAILCVADLEVRQRALARLEAAAVDLTRCRFVTIEYDDTWLRDSGPITLCAENQFCLLDFRFTGWGGKFAATRDDRLIEGLASRELFRNFEHRRVDWALEGGAIETDGAGTLLTTWRCLHQRHPEQSRAQMTRRLQDSLGVERVLWLEHGYLQGDDTDAHIDTLARFAPNDTIVFQACDDPTDAHFTELAALRDELSALRTRNGSRYRLLALPWPRPIYDRERRLPASYANYLVVNDAVLVPQYDDPADPVALQVIAAAHPGRTVVGVPCRPLIWQNGSLHCVTMQLPRGVLA